MRRSLRFLIAYRIAAAVILAPTCGLAQDDKSGFTMFNPTSAQELRPMITDRPAATDQPYTVDAGHVQAELDGWNHIADGADAGLHSTQTSYGALNARIGVTNNTEIQVMLNPIRDAQSKDGRGAVVSTSSGLATMTTRLKMNVVGDDDGDMAIAVLPYVTVPIRSQAAGTNAVTGGLSLPFAFKLSDEFCLGLMTKVDFGRNNLDTAYAATFLNSAVASYALTNQFSTYAEVLTSKPASPGRPQVMVDTGVMFALTASVQFDAGVNMGVANASAVNPFVGLSWRF